MSKKYLCMDVGGSAIKYALLDEELNFSGKGSVPTPLDGIDTYLDALTDIYQSMEDKPDGIAMSVPGVIDTPNGVCITGGHLKFAENFPLAKELESRCHVPVSIMNDAKCAAAAEAAWGALADCRDAAVIVLGTGIGGALIKDGAVHLGKNFAAGEFSWILTSDDPDIDDDYWSERSGIRRLIKMAAKAKGLSHKGITGRDVFQWAEDGDRAALWALDKYTAYISCVIMNIQAIFDPERFAIGGGISQQPLLFTYLQKNLDYNYNLSPFYRPKPKIVACKFYNDANLIGALKCYLSMFPPEAR